MVDKIFVLENGIIIEQGSHDELMRLGGNMQNISGCNQKDSLSRCCLIKYE